MAGKQIRVLVVDDSVVMREVLCAAIEGATDMIVVGTAADGRHALEQVKKLQPDVLTLDVQMPHMDGLATLEVLFAQQPLPVIMVSSLTTAGAKTTLEVLDRGALDCVPKPVISSGGSTAEFQDELRQKIRWAATVDVRRVGQSPHAAAPGVALARAGRQNLRRYSRRGTQQDSALPWALRWAVRRRWPRRSARCGHRCRPSWWCST